MAKKRGSSNSNKQNRNQNADSAADDAAADVAPDAQANVEADAQAELAKRYGPDADAAAEDSQALAANSGETGQGELDSPVDELADASVDDSVAEAADESVEELADQTLDDATADPEPAPAAKVKTGRGIAWFSLLLALASLGGAGYMYYELIHQQPLQQLNQEVSAKVDQALATVRGGESASDDKFSELRKSLGELRAAQNAALENLASQQAEQLASTEAGLMTSLNKVANAAPPSEAQWKLAELEYLLRIANHRVLMEADANGALQVLSTADAILQELDDFGLHGVRAQITDEILALKQVRGADIQGLFLRLEALKRQLSELPLRAPEFDADANQTGAQAVAEVGEETVGETSVGDDVAGVFAAMQAKISEYVQFRRLETPVKPLLGPDETMYLELNLRMMLERAQLAALRQQQEVYSQSLSSAQEWLEQYLDPQSADVAALVEEIDGLLEVDLVRELPDISGSLRTLLATERGSS